MSNIKCQMSIRFNFCRSVPPEFLRSFFLLASQCKTFSCIKPFLLYDQNIERTLQKLEAKCRKSKQEPAAVGPSSVYFLWPVFCFKLGFQSESGCDEATFPVWPLKVESGFVQPAFPLYPLSPLLPGDWFGNPEMLSLHCHQSSHNCIFIRLQNYQTRRIHSSPLKNLWMLNQNASCTFAPVKFNTFMSF